MPGSLEAYIDSQSRIVALDGPRDQGRWGWRCAAAVGDLDLGAADVELFDIILSEYKAAEPIMDLSYLRCRAGVVKPDLLDAEEVFAVRDALGDVLRVRV